MPFTVLGLSGKKKVRKMKSFKSYLKEASKEASDSKYKKTSEADLETIDPDSKYRKNLGKAQENKSKDI